MIFHPRVRRRELLLFCLYTLIRLFPFNHGRPVVLHFIAIYTDKTTSLTGAKIMGFRAN